LLVFVSLDLTILTFYISPALLPEKKRISRLVILAPPLFGGRRISEVGFGSAAVDEPQGCCAGFSASEPPGFFASLRMTAPATILPHPAQMLFSVVLI
jgi:hypothetical protein